MDFEKDERVIEFIDLLVDEVYPKEDVPVYVDYDFLKVELKKRALDALCKFLNDEAKKEEFVDYLGPFFFIPFWSPTLTINENAGQEVKEWIDLVSDPTKIFVTEKEIKDRIRKYYKKVLGKEAKKRLKLTENYEFYFEGRVDAMYNIYKKQMVHLGIKYGRVRGEKEIMDLKDLEIYRKFLFETKDGRKTKIHSMSKT